MLTKMLLGLSLLGPHPALSEDVAARLALMYAPNGKRVSCRRVTRREVRCAVRDRWLQDGVILLTEWRVHLRLDRRGMVLLVP